MFRKIRFVLVKSAHSKEGLDEKTSDQPKQEKPKSKNKFLGLFHSSSDPDLNSKSKTRKSFLRKKKKNHEKETQDSQDEAASEIVNNHIERLPDNLLPDKTLPDGSLPDGTIPDLLLPDGALADGSLPDGQLPDNDQVKNDIVDDFENASQKHSILGENSPLDPLKSMSVSTLGSMQRVNRIDIDPFPPDGEAWERAKDVWEKNEIEETKEKDKEKKRTKGKKEHRDKKREGREEKDGKTRHRSRSREKDKEHAGKEWERADSKNRSKEKKRHEKHEHDHDENKHEEKRSKHDKHKKHKSRSEKHGGGHKRDTSGGYDSDSEVDSKHEHKTDRKHRHHRHKNDSDHDRTRDHSHDHARDHANDHTRGHARDGTLDRAHAKEHNGTLDRARAKEHKHREHSKHKDDKHAKNYEEHHKHSRHKETKTEHKHTKEHAKKNSPYDEHAKIPSPYAENPKIPSPYAEHPKKVELDKVWREYESGKRYHSQEKDMKKIIDRLDGVERFRREERQRLSDRSHDRSSDTSHEVAHRSRSRERRRRSRSREKQRHESDQDSNHSSTWQYSLSRIEARQEQCKAEIDTARRSIEHRIKQLEMRFEKHYSSSERLPDHPHETSTSDEPRNYKKIIDQVADECREVTRTLEVRTEEMKSEIATVVREELTHLDEKLHSPNATPSSPGPFFGVRVVGNFRCEEATSVDPSKFTRDDDRSKFAASVTSVEPISSADESMVTVIEENSRATRITPKDCAGAESLSTPPSRDFQVRVSQSGALDTLNEPPGQKHSVSSTCDSGISADHPISPTHLRSPEMDDLHELSLENIEDDIDCEGLHVEEGHDCDGTQEPMQDMYRRKIKETEARCQERAMEEKEILYRRINELESMLLATREGKGQYV